MESQPEGCFTEGLLSLDSITVGDSRCDEHAIWVDSISAGKTWELDVRTMKPRVVHEWSLPHICDDFGSARTSDGVFGCGSLMARPSAREYLNYDSRAPRPLLSINKAPKLPRP